MSHPAPPGHRRRHRTRGGAQQRRLPPPPQDRIRHVDQLVARLLQHRQHLAGQVRDQRAAAGQPTYRHQDALDATATYVAALGSQHGPEVAAAILRSTLPQPHGRYRRPAPR